MLPLATNKTIGYIVKRYPRYSETFIVNEILAHERAGVKLEIFSQYGPVDAHFQDIISQVRSPVHYLKGSSPSGQALWELFQQAACSLPDFWTKLKAVGKTEVRVLAQAIQLALLVKARRITHLHAHFASGPATVSRLAAKFAELPYSFTAHAKDIFHQDVVAGELQEKMRNAKAVITVSDYNLRYLQRLEPQSQVVRIYNGLPLQDFAFETPRHRPAKVVAVGRLVEKKGFTYLLDACACLKAAGLKFDCEIIGTGELEEALANKITQLNLEDSVTLTGALPQRQVKERLRLAAVFVAPCIVAADNNQDGLPTVLLEAMALGTPCISTDVTGIPEVLWHEETGLMVEQGNSAHLADAIHRLLMDADLRTALAIRARAVIEQNFDSDKNAALQRQVFSTTPQEVH